MTNRLMISVAAAALIAGSGLAFAQGPGGSSRDGAPAAGGAAGGGSPPAAQQSPAPSGGAMNRDSGAAPGTSTTQSKDGMAKDGMKNVQSKDGMAKDGMKDAQSKDGMAKDSMSKDGASKTGTNAQTDSKSGATTGNAATSATAAPPPEKRTEIVSAIRSETSIKETTNVNFNISVGTRVPSSVTFYPLPSRIVEIYPQWRGYRVILVKGRYVIVQPETYEIVYVIEG